MKCNSYLKKKNRVGARFFLLKTTSDLNGYG